MDISRFLEQLAKEDEGKKNLCQTTVRIPQRHYLCEGNLGILRKDMPQNSGTAIRESIADKLEKMGVLKPNQFGGVDVSFLFYKMLANLGYPPGKPEIVRAGSLKPTQSDIIASKVKGLVQELRKNPNFEKEIIEQCFGKKIQSPTAHLTGAVPISEDNYIVDSHHRVSAIMAASRPSGNAFVCVRRIPLKMKQLLQIAQIFAKSIGMQSEAGV
jgi:hypothetical protein